MEQDRRKIDIVEFVEYCIVLDADPHEGIDILISSIGKQSIRDLSITTVLANTLLKTGLKCSFTTVNSAFAPIFASSWLRSLRYAEVSINKRQ